MHRAKFLVFSVVSVLLFKLLCFPQPPFQALRYVPCKYYGWGCVDYHVGGECSLPGLEKAFWKNFDTMQETQGSQIAVIQNGEVKCNLFGSRDGKTSAESLQVIFSTSKVVNSIATSMLVDRNKLDFDRPISHYWPAFGQNGKENITVKNLMQHSAGLSWTCDRNDTTDDTLHLFNEEVEHYFDSIKETFERSHLNFPKDSTCGYHGLTRGLILNELFRQIENRTLGDFIEEEIAAKLQVDYHLGLSAEEEKRVINHLGVTVAWALGQLFRDIYRYLAGTLPKSPQNIEAMMSEYFREGSDMALFKLSGAVGIDWWKFVDHHNEEFSRSRESPSSNGVSNALSLAKIGSIMMGMHPELLSPAGVREAMQLEPESFFDSVTKTNIHFTKAGFGRFSPEWNNLSGMYGWHGLGGQLFLFSPEKNLTFVYLTTTFNTSPPWEDSRSQVLLKELLG